MVCVGRALQCPVANNSYDAPMLWSAWVLAPLFVAGTAVVLALLLRAAGVERSGALAGVLAGALLGQTILGQAAPQIFEEHFLGGVAQRVEISELQMRQAADIAALHAIDVTHVAIEEKRAEHQQELTVATQRLDEARREHQAGQRTWILLAAVALLMLAMPGPRWPAKFGDAAFAATWTLLLVAGVVGGAAMLAFGAAGPAAAALGITYIITGRGWATTGRPILPMDESIADMPGVLRRLVDDVTFLLWLSSFSVIVVFLFRPQNTGAGAGLTLGLPIGIAIGLALRLLHPKRRRAVLGLIGPAIVASLLVLHLDGRTWQVFVPIIIGGLIGADGRWFGVASGLRWVGWRWSAGWASSLPVTDAGAAQIAAAGLLALAGILDGLMLMTAIAGAIACDLAFNLRWRLLEALLRGEAETE
jgi:hypothetical protein